VQTTEAEQILQLIAGYIDIILKKVHGGWQEEEVVVNNGGTGVAQSLRWLNCMLAVLDRGLSGVYLPSYPIDSTGKVTVIEPSHSPLYNAKVKSVWRYASTFPICLHVMVLRHRNAGSVSNYVRFYKSKKSVHYVKIRSLLFMECCGCLVLCIMFHFLCYWLDLHFYTCRRSQRTILVLKGMRAQPWWRTVSPLSSMCYYCS
jgi:hypothetical protein